MTNEALFDRAPAGHPRRGELAGPGVPLGRRHARTSSPGPRAPTCGTSRAPRYLDLVQSYGAIIAGHAHPQSSRRSGPRPATARPTARRPSARCCWPRRSRDGCRRARRSGWCRAAPRRRCRALRLARGATGRDPDREVRRQLPRPRATRSWPTAAAASPSRPRRPVGRGGPGSAGVPAAAVADTTVVALQRRARARRRPSPASSSSRSPPTWAWSPPAPGFLAGLRAECDRVGRPADLRRGHHRLPPRPRRRPGALRRHARPLVLRQGDRRRPQRRRLRRPGRRHGPPRPARPRVPGRHAVGEPAGHRGRARRARRCSTTPPTRLLGDRAPGWPPACRPRSTAPASSPARPRRRHARRPVLRRRTCRSTTTGARVRPTRRSTPRSSTPCSTAASPSPPARTRSLFPGLAHDDAVIDAIVEAAGEAAARGRRGRGWVGIDGTGIDSSRMEQLGPLDGRGRGARSPTSSTATVVERHLGRRPHALAGRPDRGRRPARLARRRAGGAGRPATGSTRSRRRPPPTAHHASSWAWAARACSPRCSPARSRPRAAGPSCGCSTPPTRPRWPASATSARRTRRCSSPRRSRAPRSRPAATSPTSGPAVGRPEQFVVVTDPGTALADAGRRARGFRAAVREPRRHRRPLLGAVVLRAGAGGAGRRRLAGLLGAAIAMAGRCGPTSTRPTTPGSGSARSSARRVQAGRDKLTLVIDREIETFGLWLEQLVAESTGKHGTGRRPGRRRAARPARGLRRRPALRRHRRAPRPRRRSPPPATRSSSSPTAARSTSAARSCSGSWPPRCAAPCSASTRSTSPTWPRPRRPPAGCCDGERARPTSTSSRSAALLDQVRPGDYVAIQAYVDPEAGVVDALEDARTAHPRPAAGGHHRRHRPPVPALDRPAAQGRPADRACSSRWSATTRSTSPIPGADLRVLDAQAGAGRRRPPDAAAPRPAGRRGSTLDDLVEVTHDEARDGRPRAHGRQHGRAPAAGRARGRRLRPRPEGDATSPTSPSWSSALGEPAAGRVGDGARRRPDRADRSTSSPACWPRATSSSTAATRTSATRCGAGRRWPTQGIGFVDAGTSGGVWGLENGYCLMVGGADEHVAEVAPALDALAPPNGLRPRRPGRRRPLHEDGPQRHRVRDDAGLRRGLRDPPRRPTSSIDADRRVEVVAAGQRRALVAARPARARARGDAPASRASAAWPPTPARAGGRSTRRSASASPRR